MALLYPAGTYFGDAPAGRLSVYLNGTTTLATIYTDPELTTVGDNPMTLDAAGRMQTNVYVINSTRYTVAVHNVSAAQVWSRNDIWGSLESITDGTKTTYNVPADFADLQTAINTIAVLPLDDVTITLDAATYAEQITFPANMNPLLRINGPTAGHPTVPTAIFDGAATPSGKGFQVNENCYVILTDIKVINYSTGQAFNNNRGRLTLINFHADNCFDGGVGQHNATTAFEGGDFDGNSLGGLGYQGLYGATHIFQEADLASTTLFHDYNDGLQIQEGAQGHLDFVKIHDCLGTGLDLRRGAGACNTKQMQIYRCGIGVKSSTGWYNNNIDFGTGANANTVQVQESGSASEFDFRSVDNTSRTMRVQSQTTITLFHTGDTVATLIWTPLQGRDHHVSEAGHVSHLHFGGNISALAANAVLTLRVWDGTTEDTVGSVSVPTGATEYTVDAWVTHTAKNAQRCTMTLDSDGGTDRSYQTGSLDLFNLAFEYRLYVQLGNAGDQLDIDQGILETTIGG